MFPMFIGGLVQWPDCGVDVGGLLPGGGDDSGGVGGPTLCWEAAVLPSAFSVSIHRGYE